jgi:MinD-like ATPase involved in chromosome partitioning or flagellar assembly
MHEGYDVGLLNDGVRHLIRELELDALIIDTHPGLNEETLLSIAICEALAIVMRPDQQDYEGTSVAVSVARKLSVPRMVLVVNNTPGCSTSPRSRSESRRPTSARSQPSCPIRRS